MDGCIGKGFNLSWAGEGLTHATLFPVRKWSNLSFRLKARDLYPLGDIKDILRKPLEYYGRTGRVAFFLTFLWLNR